MSSDRESQRSSASVAARAAGAALTFGAVLAVGLAGGWLAARQRSGAAGGAPAGESSEEAARAPAAGSPVVHLDPRTAANLGVVVTEAQPGEYVVTRDVPAEVVLLAGARRPVHAVVGGRLQRLLVEEREVVAAGAPVAELLRDPFPRPTLTLTEGLLRPLNEEFHRSLSDLKAAVQGLSIVRDELERIRSVVAGSGAQAALPAKVEVDLRYEERRAVVALENARREAERHGLTAAEIAAVEVGGTLASDLPLAQRVLARNHLWSPEAERLLVALPEDVRRLPYAVAVIGELVGAGRLTAPLVAAMEGDPELAASFLEVSGLVQSGLSVEALADLRAAGALEPLVLLRAPRGETGPPDWDVAAIHVRPGAHVEPGGAILTCVDPRRTALRLAPAGTEMRLVAEMVRDGGTVSATPLLAGAGPSFDGLLLEQLPMDDAGAGPGGALCPVENVPLCGGAEGVACRVRSWTLRPGLRYVVHVPVSRWAGCFVLPAEAVVNRGPDVLVMLEDGDGYRPVLVRVEHRDARAAVLAADGALFPGDRVVTRGAYALSLALQAGQGGAVNPHAGHNH